MNGVLPQRLSIYDMVMGKSIFVSKFDGLPSRFTTDGKAVMLRAQAGDWSIYSYQFATGQLRTLIDLSKFPPERLAYSVSPDMAFIETRTIDMDFHETGNALLWDVAKRRYRTDLAQENDTKITFSPDSSYALISDANGGLRAVSLKTGKQVTQLPFNIWYSDDGDTLFVSSDKRHDPGFETFAKLELSRGKQIVDLPDGLQPLAYAPDGKSVLAQGHDDSLHVWDIPANRERLVINTKRSKWSVEPFIFSPDSSLLVTTSRQQEGGIVSFWDMTTGKLLATREDTADTTCLAFNADGTILAAAYTGGAIMLWTVGGALP